MLKASMLPVLCQAPHSVSHPFLVPKLIILAPISAEAEQAKTASTSSSNICRRVQIDGNSETPTVRKYFVSGQYRKMRVECLLDRASL